MSSLAIHSTLVARPLGVAFAPRRVKWTMVPWTPLVKERTALKREALRANGTKFGRRKKVADAGHTATARRMRADGHTAKDIAKHLGVSRATFYRYLAENRAA